mmetsp:Transcript_8579/g.30293  ORF Transcript_8579/g.30293 Transcript_8579/m.30293 type:complete len:236 (+) Transcript_8579:327-1034(+)
MDVAGFCVRRAVIWACRSSSSASCACACASAARACCAAAAFEAAAARLFEAAFALSAAAATATAFGFDLSPCDDAADAADDGALAPKRPFGAGALPSKVAIFACNRATSLPWAAAASSAWRCTALTTSSAWICSWSTSARALATSSSSDPARAPESLAVFRSCSCSSSQRCDASAATIFAVARSSLRLSWASRSASSSGPTWAVPSARRSASWWVSPWAWASVSTWAWAWAAASG